MKQSESNLRDISLVLFGMALSKSERDPVLAAMPPGMATREIDTLLCAIRDQNRRVILEWLGERGAVVEQGKDFQQAMIDCLWSEAERVKVKGVLRELGFASKMLDAAALAERLRLCAEKLDTFPNGMETQRELAATEG